MKEFEPPTSCSQTANVCLKRLQMSLFKPILSKGDCAFTTTSQLFPSSFRLFVVAVAVKNVLSRKGAFQRLPREDSFCVD